MFAPTIKYDPWVQKSSPVSFHADPQNLEQYV